MKKKFTKFILNNKQFGGYFLAIIYFMISFINHPRILIVLPLVGIHVGFFYLMRKLKHLTNDRALAFLGGLLAFFLLIFSALFIGILVG